MSDNLEPFSTRVRKETRKIHSISDVLVNSKFSLSLHDQAVWSGGLFMFYHVFGYLEDAKERLDIPELNKILDNKILLRKQAFENDMEHYIGRAWVDIPMTQALEDYILHLQDLELNNPTMLLAYVYHLYLGLLSGGQILAAKRKYMGDSTRHIDDALNFPNVKLADLKAEIKRALNDIAEDKPEEWKEAFIAESNKVFILNNAVVKSIEGQNKVIDRFKKIVYIAVVMFVVYVAAKKFHFYYW